MGTVRTGRAVKLPQRVCAALALSAFMIIPGAWAETPPYIAGVHPDQRPPSAPKIETYTKGADWLAKATRGVEKPIPPSLKFLDDQGGWYTPFTRPGMTGRYDIRHWHQAAGDKPRSQGGKATGQ